MVTYIFDILTSITYLWRESKRWHDVSQPFFSSLWSLAGDQPWFGRQYFAPEIILALIAKVTWGHIQLKIKTGKVSKENLIWCTMMPLVSVPLASQIVYLIWFDSAVMGSVVSLLAALVVFRCHWNWASDWVHMGRPIGNCRPHHRAVHQIRNAIWTLVVFLVEKLLPKNIAKSNFFVVMQW